jgi:chemotaxis protein MotB
LTSQSQVDALRTENFSLAEQNRAQAAQIENFQVHNRNAEGQLARTEESLALAEERLTLTQRQLATYQHQHEQLHEDYQHIADWKSRVSPEVRARLTDISRRCPSLQFDPQTGVSKLDTDILFDSGTEQLRPDGERVLGELVQLMRSSEAKGLKLLIVGHTDDRQISGRPERERYPNNFHLSAGRALAVADQLHRLGLPEERIGVAGFGPTQPVAPNLTAKERQKNRRVEIFVMAPEVPVIGWTESTPSLY